MSDRAGECVDLSPRWKRRLNNFRMTSHVARWGVWPTFWYRLDSLFLNLTMGDPGWFGDWAAEYRWQHLVHRWFCRRWTPAWDRELARNRGALGAGPIASGEAAG